MKKIISLTAAIVALTAITMPSLAEETSDGLEYELTLDFVSQYIWRGQQLTDGYTFQPGFSIISGNFTANIWGSMDMASVNGTEYEFTEVDYTLDYSDQLTDGIGYSIGVIYYDFPSTDLAATTELYFGLSFDAPLSPSITVYQDIDEVNGTYANLSVGHSFGEIGTLGEDMPIGMEFGASLGYGDSSYNGDYWTVSDAGLNDLVLSLSFPIELKDGWAFSASVNYVTIMDDDISDTLADEDYVYTGFGLAKSF